MADDAQVRRRRVRGALRRIGDQYFDPDVHLIRGEVGAGAHYIPEASLEYAVLLFDGAVEANRDLLPREPADQWWASEAAVKDPGAVQRQEGNAVLRAILDGQDRRSGSPTLGHFRWHRHDQEVHDLNATAFVTHGLGHVLSTYRRHLTDEVATATGEALELAVTAMLRRDVPVEYTNIQLLTIGGLVQAARALDWDEPELEALRRFDRWVELTDRTGLHEWTCQTYTPLALVGLEAAWAAVRQPGQKERLQRALDLLNRLTAAHFLPGGAVGGAAARSYSRDLTGRSNLSVYAHLKFGTALVPGTLERSMLLAASSSFYDYAPPADWLGELERGWRSARTIEERTGTTVRRHHHEGRLAVASQDMSPPCGSPPGPVIFVVRDAPGSAPTVALMPSAHPKLAAVTARCAQQGTTVLVELTWPSPATAADPAIEEPVLLVHDAGSLRSVLLDEQPWDGRLRAGNGSMALELAFDECRLRVALHDPASPRIGWQLERDGDVVRLRLLPPVARLDDRPRCAVLLDAAPSGASRWSVAVLDAGFEATEDGGTRRLRTAASAPAFDAPLFRDPSLTLRPGQFRQVVEGTPIPFEEPS